jgi:hypothetical protein
MKIWPRMLFRSGVLMVATLVIMILAWSDYCMIMNGLSTYMMGFEQEPAQGWNYWRWYFIKEHLSGILCGAAIIFVLFGLVLYGWVELFKNLKKH